MSFMTESYGMLDQAFAAAACGGFQQVWGLEQSTIFHLATLFIIVLLNTEMSSILLTNLPESENTHIAPVAAFLLSAMRSSLNGKRSPSTSTHVKESLLYLTDEVALSQSFPPYFVLSIVVMETEFYYISQLVAELYLFLFFVRFAKCCVSGLSVVYSVP